LTEGINHKANSLFKLLRKQTRFRCPSTKLSAASFALLFLSIFCSFFLFLCVLDVGLHAVMPVYQRSTQPMRSDAPRLFREAPWWPEYIYTAPVGSSIWSRPQLVNDWQRRHVPCSMTKSAAWRMEAHPNSRITNGLVAGMVLGRAMLRYHHRHFPTAFMFGPATFHGPERYLYSPVNKPPCDPRLKTNKSPQLSSPRVFKIDQTC
jgi:hypothetical protein